LLAVPFAFEHTCTLVVVELAPNPATSAAANADTDVAVVIGPAAAKLLCAGLEYPCTEYSAATRADVTKFAATIKKNP
jgi:hypothetical protein